MIVALLACAPPPPCACDRVALPDAQIVDEAGLRALLDAAGPILYPDLADVRVDLALVDDLQYFRAFTDLATVSDPPRERRYIVEVDPALFDDPPSNDALRAVLAHELGHIRDYVAMDTDELVAFAIWYAGGELGSYERETDEQALTVGCATGLSAYRTWVYAHTDGEIEAEKRRNYYTPEEIDAWVAESQECAS